MKDIICIERKILNLTTVHCKRNIVPLMKPSLNNTSGLNFNSNQNLGVRGLRGRIGNRPLDLTYYNNNELKKSNHCS